MEFTSNNLTASDISETKNILSRDLISKSLKKIASQIELGEIQTAKNNFKNLIIRCEILGRLPQLKIKLEEYKEIKYFGMEVDIFLSQGDTRVFLNKGCQLIKYLKFLNKEEVFNLIATDVLNWDTFRDLVKSLSGGYHDIRVLKLFLAFVLLKKESLVDSARLFNRKYPVITRLCYNLFNEEDKNKVSEIEVKKYEKIKVIKKRFDFDFSSEVESKKTVTKINKSVPLGEDNLDLSEIFFLDSFIELYKKRYECLDALILNQLYRAASFYFNLIKDSLSKEQRNYYFVEINRRNNNQNQVIEYIKKEKLINDSNPNISHFYYKVLTTLK